LIWIYKNKMANLNIGQATTPTTIIDYSTELLNTEGAGGQDETFYDNPNFSKWYGNYNKIAKIKMSINAYATWVVGRGWNADPSTKVILESLRGWGEDTFLSILWNMLVIKKVNGDAFAEIMRNDEENRIINIKPLDPSSIRIVVNRKGIIERYEQLSKSKKPNRKIQVQDMLHFCNDRVADNIHGTSVIEAVEWNIEAQEEARRTHRKMIKRNGIVRIIELDTEDTTKRNSFKAEWKTAIDNGDILILPKGVAEAKDWHGNLDTNGVISWLNYLDDEFYQMIGIPKIIIGGSGSIEGDSKISYLTFEQIYTRESQELIDDIWNQLYLKIQLSPPVSLKNEITDTEQANSSQTGFQPNDTTAGVGV
jgi:hypothetical protein